MSRKNLTYFKLSLLILSIFYITDIRGAELFCTVDVDASMIEGTNKNVFESLRSAITDYMNETDFTDAVFSPEERIECRFFLTVREYSGDRIRGDLQIQLSRPVYNSSYMSPVFNMKDTNVEFDYREGDTLVFTDNVWTDNLTGILDFYAYLLIGMDFDTFSPNGGQPYFNKAASIVQKAQSSGEAGWRIFEDDRNRSAMINVFTENRTSAMRDLLYRYHRKGLDEMTTSPEKGRKEITDSLEDLTAIYSTAPQSVAITMFRDAKLDELVNLYSKSSKEERDKALEILTAIYPAERNRLDRIKNPK